MSVEIFPLGAGQEVGRSCILIKIHDKNIILDCGLHMGYQDERKFPNFSLLKEPSDSLTDIIDLTLISHFHLDHCGALPYMTEIVGYNGPVLMTAPTKAMIPYMLEDFKRVVLDTNRGGNEEEKDMDPEQQMKNMQQENKRNKGPTYTSKDIDNCIAKFQVINLHQTVQVNDIKVKAYYAGHVLGACMFLIEYKGTKVVYTGDFNSNADRHLGAAWIDKCRPDVLITETTYADTLRDSKRTRERDFLKNIQDCIDNGGKVLIPVFALGRAQELCILLETYWSRTKSKVPIYFAAGLTEKANFYYKLFTNWTNEKIKSTFIQNNLFDFKHISPFDKTFIKSPHPMVLFATPGMLHGGLSMQVFKEWCGDEKNLLIIPGYCVAGTLGNKLLSGMKTLNIDNRTYDVRMKIRNMSFSAHADAKGILGLIKHAEPRNVVFVHGDKRKMEVLREVIIDSYNLPCYMPANFERIVIKDPEHTLPLLISPKTILNTPQILSKDQDYHIFSGLQKQKFKGCALYSGKSDEIKIMDVDETVMEINSILKMIKNDNQDLIVPHKIDQSTCIKISFKYMNHFFKESGGESNKAQTLMVNDIKHRLSEKIKDSLDFKSSDFELLRNLVSFEIHSTYLLINIDKYDENNKTLEQNLSNYLDILETILSSPTH